MLAGRAVCPGALGEGGRFAGADLGEQGECALDGPGRADPVLRDPGRASAMRAPAATWSHRFPLTACWAEHPDELGFTVQQRTAAWRDYCTSRPRIGKASDGVSHACVVRGVRIAHPRREPPDPRRDRGRVPAPRAGAASSPVPAQRVAASHAFADAVADHRPIYGRSTGVGANRETGAARTRLPGPAAAALPRHQLGPAPLGRAGAGDARGAAQPARRRRQRHRPDRPRRPGGHARAADALPPVREGGSVGTADLAALATTALVLLRRGTEHPARDAHRRVRRRRRADLHVEQRSRPRRRGPGRGRPRPPRPQRARRRRDGLRRRAPATPRRSAAPSRSRPRSPAPSGSAGRCASWSSPTPTPARIQDPFGLRTFPQVHGALMDRLAFAERGRRRDGQRALGEPDRLRDRSGSRTTAPSTRRTSCSRWTRSCWPWPSRRSSAWPG